MMSPLMRKTACVCLLPCLPLACTAPQPKPPVPDEPRHETVAPQPQPRPAVEPPIEPAVVKPLPSTDPPADKDDTSIAEPAQPVVSPAVVALLETAREQAAAGADEQAAASLERALRIDPGNPWLWHRLGVLRLQQGHYQEAIELAGRSNSYAADNPRVQAGNWELIARARGALGDMEAAEQARIRARELGGVSYSD